MPGRLLLLLADEMGIDPSEIDEESNFETLARWDSQREIELAFMLEREYGIAIDRNEMTRLRSVHSIREILHSRGIADP